MSERILFGNDIFRYMSLPIRVEDSSKRVGDVGHALVGCGYFLNFTQRAAEVMISSHLSE